VRNVKNGDVKNVSLIGNVGIVKESKISVKEFKISVKEFD